jgi:hypothetical protein
MTHDELIGQWMNKQVWLEGSEPEIELTQAREEGRDIGLLESEFALLISAAKDGKKDVAWHWRAGELCDEVQELPFVNDYRYAEPSDLPSIQALSTNSSVPEFNGSDAELLRKLHGGLLGRICGCVLGKPFEGWHKPEIQTWCEATGNWPLADYIREPNDSERAIIVSKSARTELGWAKNWTREKLVAAVEDDDINYTVAGFDIVKRYGADFRPVDVAEYWCNNLPIFMCCTAERVAYRNFVMSVLPPDSATHRNPYREWIGAQIRADSFGYLNPGNPRRAADWAWRDASVSHIRNGIYGEMWVAAMLAAAYVLTDFEAIILAGLAQIPTNCRLHEAIIDVTNARHDGKTFDEVVALVHARWDERTAHGWCHTISNAQLVAVALLWGEGDYGLTITRAVMPGFDTDCNGATAGSVWGIVHGVDAIPDFWSRPFNDTMQTHLLHWRQLKISDLAGQMASLAHELR